MIALLRSIPNSARTIILLTAWLLLGSLPVAAVSVDIILYNGTDNEICDSSVNYYSLYVRSTFLGEVYCNDVTWKFYENNQLVQTYKSNSSLEIVAKVWAAGTDRIEVSVKKCGFLTSSGSTAMNLTVGPLPPASISGPANLCPSETRTYSIASIATANSFTWNVPTGFKINGGGTQLANTGATSVSIRAPSSTSATSGLIKVSANYPNGYDYPNCGTSDPRTRAVKLLKTTLSTPSYVIGPNQDLCENGTATYSIPAVDGADSYEWEVLGVSFPLRTTTTHPSLTIWGYDLDGPGSYQIRVRAKNRCGAVSSWRSATIYVLSSSDPDCSCPQPLAPSEPGDSSQRIYPCFEI